MTGPTTGPAADSAAELMRWSEPFCHLSERRDEAAEWCEADGESKGPRPGVWGWTVHVR